MLCCAAPLCAHAQAAPATTSSTPAVSRQRGTVKAISGETLTLVNDGGQQVAVVVTPTAKVVQLAPGSTDLKGAQPITLADVAVGDRVLVLGAAGTDAGSFTAGRVILMKSTDIAAQHAREESDWQRRGTGGIVASVDAAAGTLSITARGRAVTITTTPSTIFRRYAGDSVKFEDAKRGTLDQLHTGDQVRVRGERSADGASVAAEEVVSGRFENLSGTLTAVDAGAGTVTLRDLATKRIMTVSLTKNSAVHVLPPEVAVTMTARSGAEGATGGGAGKQAGATPSGPPAHVDGAPGTQPRSGQRRSGADLSQVVGRLPNATIADLHQGDAVLVVATPGTPGGSTVTAITLVSGVQSILAAAQGNAPAVTLSPWSLGGAPAEGGGQ